VRIAADGELLTIDVGDDGIGGARATPDGTGLAGLGDRIAALDGELTITSPPQRGTTLHAAIPLDSTGGDRTSGRSSSATTR
jgi:signal transduction histidine kinase